MTNTAFRRLIYCCSIFVGMPYYSLMAQVQGNNAVYSGTSPIGSGAFVDVAAFCGGSAGCSGADFCSTLKSAISGGGILSTGGILDARGMAQTSSGTTPPLPCTTDPFASVSWSNTLPITVLLPAATIDLQNSLVLRPNTRLVGEGEATQIEDLCTNNPNNQTWTCSFANGSYLITMGSSSCPGSVCSGISIEKVQLQLNQNAGTQDLQLFGGIQNEYASQSSYVDHVRMTGLANTGLYVLADGSGPYTNLSYISVSGTGCGGSSTAVCADLEAQTQGLHGITCLGNSNTASSTTKAGGIIVNNSNNAIENAHVEAFFDGIVIGSKSGTNATNTLISNVYGGASANCNGQGSVTNTVHISKAATVTNVTVLEAANGTAGNNTIEDNVTGTVIANCPNTGCSVPLTTAEYSLGSNQLGVNSINFYPVIATAPSNSSEYGNASTVVPTWGVGSSTTVSGESCLTPGALYSSTANNQGHSLYLCTYVGGSLQWVGI